MWNTYVTLTVGAVIAGLFFAGALALRLSPRRRSLRPARDDVSDLVLGSLIALVLLCLTLMLAFAIPSSR